nr:hypothetical protein [Cytophagales bacterium]
MTSLMQKYATKRNLVLLIILTVLSNISLGLYFIDFHAPILDTVPYYSAEYAYEAIGAYGEAYKKTYIRGTLLLDFIYPIIYCLMLAFALCRVQKSVSLAFFPFLILPVDYLENILLIFLVSEHPETYLFLAGFAGLVTLTKWSMVLISLSVIIFFLVLRFFKGRSKGKRGLSYSVR